MVGRDKIIETAFPPKKYKITYPKKTDLAYWEQLRRYVLMIFKKEITY
jgi:hypothetical protein